jgi:hypothetical protein
MSHRSWGSSEAGKRQRHEAPYQPGGYVAAAPEYQIDQGQARPSVEETMSEKPGLETSPGVLQQFDVGLAVHERLCTERPLL